MLGALLDRASDEPAFEAVDLATYLEEVQDIAKEMNEEGKDELVAN